MTHLPGAGFPPARGALQNPCQVGIAPGLCSPNFIIPILAAGGLLNKKKKLFIDGKETNRNRTEPPSSAQGKEARRALKEQELSQQEFQKLQEAQRGPGQVTKKRDSTRESL